MLSRNDMKWRKVNSCANCRACSLGKRYDKLCKQSPGNALATGI